MKLIAEIQNIEDPTQMKRFEHESNNLTLLVTKMQGSFLKKFLLGKKSSWRIKKIASDSPIVLTLVQTALGERVGDVHLELLEDQPTAS
jgi:hypothetical protein